MEQDTKRILLHMLETMLEQQQIICDLTRSDSMVIEAVRKRNEPSHVATAQQVVDATGDSVLGLSNRIERLADQVRRFC